ncbi:MAG: hypothetical protein ACT4OO_14060 [Nitrospiraceae bacterium]
MGAGVSVSSYRKASALPTILRLLLLFAALVLLGFHTALAETVSIINMDSSREAVLLEAGLRRLLRAEGYTVKGGTTEGYVVLLHGAQTKQGASIGIVGSATVVRVLERASAAALLSDSSLREQEFVRKFTELMGSPVIYLASTTAIGGDADAVAEILSIYIRTAVRQSSLKSPELLRALEQSTPEHESTPGANAGR